MVQLKEIFTPRNVLRAGALGYMAFGISAVVAPAAVLGLFFKKSAAEPEATSQSDKTDLPLQFLGISAVTSGAISYLQPTRDSLHVKIVEALACLVHKVYHRSETAEKNPSADKRNANIFVAVHCLLLVSLLAAKRNDDVDTGKEWYEL